MLAITHALVSLPFAYYLDNVFLIFLGAFVFHLFVDTLLHWNVFPEHAGKHFYLLAAIDVGAALFAGWLLTQGQFFTWPVLAAVAGGLAPDALHQTAELLTPRWQHRRLPWLRRALRFHENLQLETTEVGAGLLWQIVVLGGAVALIMLPRLYGN